MPELRRESGQIALPCVWQAFLAAGTVLCLEADSRGMAEGEILRFRRPPQYASFLYLFLGIVLRKGLLESLALVPPFLVFAVARILPEERELTARFGEACVAYESRAPALLPPWSSRESFLRSLFPFRE